MWWTPPSSMVVSLRDAASTHASLTQSRMGYRDVSGAGSARRHVRHVREGDSRMRQFTAERLSGFGTSVFSEMSRLAAEHNAINLGQGFPDFPGPNLVKEAAVAAIHADLNQYAPSHGLPRLRRAIAADFARAHGREVDPEAEVTVTSGATEALHAVLLACVNP